MINSLVSAEKLRTPVLFLVFNRPDTTQRVFEAIRKAKPPRLYIAADGARTDRPGEAQMVEQVREIAIAVDWPCDVKTLFREVNLGCKYAVSGAITWFFEHEEQGIILEDDCLPSQSFFWFCENLLNHYKQDLRIWHISGNNFYDQDTSDYSYTFGGVFGSIWGWATWRDRWSKYDVEISSFEEAQGSGLLRSCYGGGRIVNSRMKDFKAIRCGLNTWDFQWVFCRWVNSALTIVPSVNMVENLGFGPNATHTFGKPDPKKVKKAEEINFPLIHPSLIIRNALMEATLLKRPVFILSYPKRVFKRILTWVKK